MGAVLSPFANGLPTTGGTITGPLTVQGQLTTAAPPVIAGYAPVVVTTDQVVSGAVQGALVSGITVPSGGFAAGQVYRIHAWGQLTTAAGTDTVTFALLVGGLGGTQVFTFGAQQPNSGGAVAGVSWEVDVEMELRTALQTSVRADDGLNFFPSALTNQTATITNASPQQIVLAVTNSAAGDSVTAHGGYCMRIN